MNSPTELVIDSSFCSNLVRPLSFPLMQEYFYGDFGKISLVLGEGFCRGKKVEGINYKSPVFAAVPDYDVSAYLEALVYEIKAPEDMEDEDFIKAIKLLLNEPISSDEE